jgi:Phosphotransferase enzyme family
MQRNIASIFAQFKTDTQLKSYRHFGSGHINDTILVKTVGASDPDFVLQLVNHHIFKDVPGLMHNIATVTDFIRSYLKGIPGSDPDSEVLTLIKTHEGKAFTKDEKGNYWRCYLYIPDTFSYDKVDSEEKAVEGGRIFGKFQSILSGLDAKLLTETIPYFHDLEKRLETFRNTIARNPVNRVELVTEEIRFVEERAEELLSITQKINNGEIPIRITHNDTKFNNILFDKQNHAQCIVDLDTVMPGSVLHDFGDAIRTAANTAVEDEADLSKISLDMKLFKAYSSGYMSEAYLFLTKAEIENLALSSKFMVFIIGLRFLTDYIDGDNYFKVQHPEHNLQRCRAQFQLVRSIESQFGEMQQVINTLAGRYSLSVDVR